MACTLAHTQLPVTNTSCIWLLLQILRRTALQCLFTQPSVPIQLLHHLLLLTMVVKVH
jgi:hypothetical protein